MNEKSKFRESLEELTDDQFKAVQADMAAASAARGNPAEFARKVANMSEGEWQRFTSEMYR